MPIVQFFGKVLPKEATINIGSDPKIKWPIPERDLEPEFSLRIHASVVEVDCAIARTFVPDDLEPLYQRALDLAKASVGLVAFAMGFGLTVILDEMQLPGEEKINVLLGDPRLPPLCGAFKVNGDQYDPSFNEVLLIVLLSQPLQMALDDIIEAITYSHRSPVNCARAVERLRHLIAPNESKKDGWTKLRETLRFDKKYLEFITGYSEGPRHGDPSFISGAICGEITVRTWIIFNRYFEFKKRGSLPLPLAEFPDIMG